MAKVKTHVLFGGIYDGNRYECGNVVMLEEETTENGARDGHLQKREDLELTHSEEEPDEDLLPAE